MRRPTLIRPASAATLLLLAGALTACAPGTTAPTTEGGSEPSAAAPEPATDSTADTDEGYAFDVNRDAIARSVEAGFSTKNGKARWEGDTLILAVDGDATAAMAGFTECRVLLEFLLEDDVSIIEYPNGRLACADVLAN